MLPHSCQAVEVRWHHVPAWKGVLQRVAMTMLIALALVPCSVTALTLSLHSNDYTFTAGTAVEDNVVAAKPSYCLVYELMQEVDVGRPGNTASEDVAKYLYGFVRFTLESNVTSVDLRNSLVLSVHPPDESQSGVADLRRVHTYKSYSPRDVERHQVAAEMKKQRLLAQRRAMGTGDLVMRVGEHKIRRRTRERLVDGSLPTGEGDDHDTDESFDDETARSFSFTVRPVLVTGAAATMASVRGNAAPPVVEGTYALCFTLDRTTTPAGRLGKPTHLVERVDVHLHESFTSTSTAHPNGKLADRALQRTPLKADDTAGVMAYRQLGARTVLGAEQTYLESLRKLHGGKISGRSMREVLAKQRAEVDEDVLELLRLHAIHGGGVVRPGPLGSGNFYHPEELRKRSHDLLDALRTVLAITESSESILARHVRMQATAESTFTRIWIAFGGVALSIAASVWVTFTYTKRIIVKRKLI